jgi:predicted acyltransferase
MPDAPNNDRLVSLDVFRGMTIAGMVLVNNPGTWSAIYGPLKHAEWHGITPTDYIFPFFLFIVGVAIPIALARHVRDRPDRGVYLKILSRAAKIFALGLLIYAIPFFDFVKTAAPQSIKLLITLSFAAALFFYLVDRRILAGIIAGISVLAIAAIYAAGIEIVWYDIATMRIPGVLQRIAVCYLIVSLIHLHTDWKQQVGIAAALLLIYWLLMTLMPVPGCDVATIDDKACNLSAYVDRMILTEAHLWSSAKVFDPEGILSTLPALVTTISGVLTGTWLRNDRSKTEKACGLFFAGTILLAAGWSWGLIFPINKSLWTSSYVLYTSGLALLTLGVCYWLIDAKGIRRWSTPFIIFGVNALALYVFSGIMSNLLWQLRVTGATGASASLQEWIFANFFLSWAAPVDASIAFAVSYVLLWLLLMWLLYRKRIYIKV